MLTEQVREALRKKFSSSDWIVMEEVGNAPGLFVIVMRICSFSTRILQDALR